MPYIEVHLNDKKLSVGGDDEIDFLTFTLIATKDNSLPQISLSGMRNLGNNKSEFMQWIHEEVDYGCNIKIIILEAAISDLPISKSMLQKKMSNMLGSTSKAVFDITMSNTPNHLRAEIDEEETLQLVLAQFGVNHEYSFKVDSLTVAEDGSTKGKHWFNGSLKSDEWVEIKVMSEN